MSRTMWLKKVDRLLGPVLSQVSRVVPPRNGSREEPGSILLLRPGGIGDAVLLVPALLLLKQAFPGAVISVLAERRNSAAFSLCQAVDHLYHYDDPADLVRAIRGGYDVVIDTEQWHRLSAVVARLTRAPWSIGFATNGRKALFRHKIRYSHDRYEAWSFLDLLGPLRVEVPEALPLPFLSVPEAAARRGGELLAVSPNPNFVAIFPGASIAERRWGHDNFRELAARLARDGVVAVVVGGEEDADEGDLIVRGCGGINLAGMTTLAETAAIIARSGALVSGDSGVLHIAVGLGVPTVSLFGPGIEAKWGPRGEGHLVLNRRLPCSPCTRFGTTPPCPIGAKCLADIGVDEVFAGVTSLLQRRNSR